MSKIFLCRLSKYLVSVKREDGGGDENNLNIHWKKYWNKYFQHKY